MDYERAISQGIDSARGYRKEGLSPYPDRHPLFQYWFRAAVMKSDVPFLSEDHIRKTVMDKFRSKRP